jgi:hypothetical protein
VDAGALVLISKHCRGTHKAPAENHEKLYEIRGFHGGDDDDMFLWVVAPKPRRSSSNVSIKRPTPEFEPMTA